MTSTPTAVLVAAIALPVWRLPQRPASRAH